MNARIVLSILIVSFGLVAAILPQKQNSSIQLDAAQLLYEIQLRNHVISVDEMADAIINNDPYYQLIDLRSPEEFQTYNLPGSLNIPFDKLFTAEWAPYIDQVARKNVFYSNGSTLANEAWMLTRQKGMKNNYILEGGLNNWIATILTPTSPESTFGDEAINSFQARLGARQYFSGESASSASSANNAPRKPVPAKKKTKVAGGCS
ncbi:MAG: rhodanese-like domain-containing protein [Cyclobacteriaceae bacterium]|nr:rhodanese-like domain-containing protein [Cyclobacteriaceae bacterium]